MVSPLASFVPRGCPRDNGRVKGKFTCQWPLVRPHWLLLRYRGPWAGWVERLVSWTHKSGEFSRMTRSHPHPLKLPAYYSSWSLSLQRCPGLEVRRKTSHWSEPRRQVLQTHSHSPATNTFHYFVIKPEQAVRHAGKSQREAGLEPGASVLLCWWSFLL